MAVKFLWDEAKRKSNLRKHGIDFLDVREVFEGRTLTYEDDPFPYRERRFITIGLLRATVVQIAHTEQDEIIRIIHARKANRQTTAAYFTSFRD